MHFKIFQPSSKQSLPTPKNRGGQHIAHRPDGSQRRLFVASVALMVTVLAIAMQACSGPPTSAANSTTPTAPAEVQSSPTAASPSATNTLISTATPTPGLTATASSALVTVTAVNGRVAIRTGPDISFDAIAALENGQTVTAIARSILDGWVEIQIPSQPGETGWVSTESSHSIVIGDVLDLPRIDVVEWNSGAYLMNCTQHRLVVKPGDQVIEPATSSSDNRAWFAPGLYSVYDLDMTKTPLIIHLDMPARSVVKIRTDGSGQKSQCP